MTLHYSSLDWTSDSMRYSARCSLLASLPSYTAGSTFPAHRAVDERCDTHFVPPPAGVWKRSSSTRPSTKRQSRSSAPSAAAATRGAKNALRPSRSGARSTRATALPSWITSCASVGGSIVQASPTTREVADDRRDAHPTSLVHCRVPDASRENQWLQPHDGE